MTAKDLYFKISPNKKKIMCYESAFGFLALSNGWLNILYFYYEDGFFRSSSQVFGFKVDRLDNVESIIKNNSLVTSPEQTL